MKSDNQDGNMNEKKNAGLGGIGMFVRTHKGLFSILALLCLFSLGAYMYVSSQSFMGKAAEIARTQAGEALGTDVEIGSVAITSPRAIDIHDVVVYDKDSRRMADVEHITVKFSPLSMISNPGSAISSVDVENVKAELIQREDESWNCEDLISEAASKSAFTGKINLKNALVKGKLNSHTGNGQSLTAEVEELTLDFVDQPDSGSVRVDELLAQVNGTEIKASGSFGGTRQTLVLKTGDVNLQDYLAFIPEGTITDVVSDIGGHLDKLDVAATMTGQDISLSGQADFSRGTAVVMGTKIENTRGLVVFNDKDAAVFVRAEASGQEASVHGKVFWDKGIPYMKLIAETQNFDPSKILTEIPFEGKVAANAEITGTFDDPVVKGTFKVASGAAYGFGFSNAEAKAEYQAGRVIVNSFSLDALGGNVKGEGEFNSADSSYLGHAVISNVDASQLSEYIGDVGGIISGDVAISGKGADIDGITAYGSINGKFCSYKNVQLEEVKASFYKKNGDIRIDAAELKVPNGGTLTADGTVNLDAGTIDTSFYGTNLDMSLIKGIDSRLDAEGLADIRGTVRGSLSNPVVKTEFSAIEGAILKQPFRTMHGALRGNLDGVQVDSFSMENGGDPVWIAQGVVGFTGKKVLNLRVDTMKARMEDLAALIAPGQPITGNVDNVITITGTMDNPKIQGYVHFYDGSYNGLLLQGMDGDYFLNDGILTLQVFHVYSPMVDMVLNGTVNVKKDYELNLTVAAKDFQMDRLGRKLPYPATGRGSFEGHITGTASKPLFDGRVEAPELTINGVDVLDSKAVITYAGNRVSFEELSFKQNGGSYKFKGSANVSNGKLQGKLEVEQGDINALMAIGNLKNDIVHGQINCKIDIAGTISNPMAHLDGYMAKGTVAGCDVSDIIMDIGFANNVATIDKFTGNQGTDGSFDIKGELDLDGPLSADVTATGIDAKIISGMANLDTGIRGKINANAHVGGTTKNPDVELKLNMEKSGVGFSTFDNIEGDLHLKDGIINVNKLKAETQMAKKTGYSVEASGKVPLAALDASVPSADAGGQFDLTISLDDADLGILPVITKQVEWGLGDLAGTLRLTGNAKKPYLNGSVTMKGGALKLTHLEKPITDMNVQIDVVASHINLKEFSGKMGKGTYDLTGSMDLNGYTPTNYNFSLVADKLDVQADFYKGPLTANLSLSQQDVFIWKNVPKISGTVTIADTLLSIPSIPDSTGELPRILLDVNLDLGKNVRFFSTLGADVKLAGGVHFGGTTDFPRNSGSIHVTKGTISYLKSVFKVREAVARFGVQGTFIPNLTLQADTKIGKTTVYLALDGPADHMDFKLTSSPAMSKTEILQFLTLRSAYQSGRSIDKDFTNMLNIGFQMSVLSEIENSVRNVLNLDEFIITRDTLTGKKDTANDGSEVYNVTVGKYLSDKVMVEFTKGINSQTYKYNLTYDFNDRIGMKISRDEEHSTEFTIEARFTF